MQNYFTYRKFAFENTKMILTWLHIFQALKVGLRNGNFYS